jgi:multiple sugar transport system permease protein
MIASLVLSFTSYEGLAKPRFIGVENYVQVFIRDKVFYGSVDRTLYYALVSVPLGLFGSFLLAVLLNQAMYGRALYRTLFYLPSLTPGVALVILWLWILQPQFGLMNYLLRQIGIEGPPWFGSMEWAIPSLILMHWWNDVGGGRMIIFLAALQGVPNELYEAAAIDGANGFQRFWNITFPMVSPAFLFNLILGIIGALKVFESAFIATAGGPARATWFFALHIYFNAFRWLHMGYACALAWVFFVIVLLLTVLQLKWAGGWVYYAGEVRK